MSKLRYSLVALILPIALTGFITVPALAQKSKAQTQEVVYRPPTIQLTASPTVVTACAGDARGARVQLDARASFPTGTGARYSWSASGGRIEGSGPNPTWDLTGLEPGYYKAFVEIGDVADCVAFSEVAVLVKCQPPVCPHIYISCPDRMTPNQPVTFSANVAGGFPSITPVYNWTVSAGRIISGEGTSSITVDTTGLKGGQSIQATLTMPGYDALDCSQTCLVQIPPEPPSCRPFDQFANIARNDEKARLDNYAIELQNDPSSTAYVFVYPGQRGKAGEVQQHITRVVDYLVNSRGIDQRRIVTRVGPTRTNLIVELFICPEGAKAPTPSAMD